MRRRRFLAGSPAVLGVILLGPALAALGVAPARSEEPPGQELVYYQLLYLAYLTRQGCGLATETWPEALQRIRRGLVEHGCAPEDLAAVEANARRLGAGLPCGSKEAGDLLALTANEPGLALGWFEGAER